MDGGTIGRTIADSRFRNWDSESENEKKDEETSHYIEMENEIFSEFEFLYYIVIRKPELESGCKRN